MSAVEELVFGARRPAVWLKRLRRMFEEAEAWRVGPVREAICDVVGVVGATVVQYYR